MVIHQNTTLKRTVRAICLITAIHATPFALAPAHSEERDERVVKAAFLNYFVQLIRWPDPEATKTIAFCAAAESTVYSLLKELVELRMYENLSVNFSLISTARDASECDYVFIDSDNREFSLPVIATTRGRAILTVSDVEGFAAAGGVIELRRHERRIVVRINVDALAGQGLKTSSKLLSVAERVTTKEANGGHN